MTRNRVRTFVLSCVALLCSLVLITVATYALFSDYTKVTNHLQAGNLDIELHRIGYQWKHIDANGFIDEIDNDDVVDFTHETEENIFGLDDGALTAPGCEYTATMRVTNTGSVAFKYWIEIVLDKDDYGVALAGQLEVEIKDANGEKVVLLDADGKEITDPIYLNNEGKLVYGEENGIGVVGVKEEHKTSVFSVTVKFVKHDNNNAAMGNEIEFDLIVYAQQIADQPAEWQD